MGQCCLGRRFLGCIFLGGRGVCLTASFTYNFPPSVLWTKGEEEMSNSCTKSTFLFHVLVVKQRIVKYYLSMFAKESSTEHIWSPSSSWRGRSRRQHGWCFICINFGNKSALVTRKDYCWVMHIVVFVSSVCSCCHLICCLGICCQAGGGDCSPLC